jgi:hypothetical protein
VHHAVVSLGGSIDVQSNLGVGASIEITVPVGADVYVPASGLSMLPAYRSNAPPRPNSAAVG